MNSDLILELGRNSLTREDIDVLYKTANGADVVVEIGARHGCSSMLFGSIAKKVYSIECDPQPDWQKNLDTLGIKNVKMIVGYSPWINISENIDYLFIDGDHRTMCCIADYVFFMPFVKVGGKIAFHDTEMKKENCAFMVNRAIDIIVEESKNLKEIARSRGEMGTVVFEKIKPFGDK